MVLEEASRYRGKPTLVSEAPAPGNADPPPPAELEAKAVGLMSNLSQMVDMMLRGPLASLGQEEGQAFYQHFTGSSSPK